jgi:hypothetical protein
VFGTIHLPHIPIRFGLFGVLAGWLYAVIWLAAGLLWAWGAGHGLELRAIGPGLFFAGLAVLALRHPHGAGVGYLLAGLGMVTASPHSAPLALPLVLVASLLLASHPPHS